MIDPILHHIVSTISIECSTIVDLNGRSLPNESGISRSHSWNSSGKLIVIPKMIMDFTSSFSDILDIFLPWTVLEYNPTLWIIIKNYIAINELSLIITISEYHILWIIISHTVHNLSWISWSGLISHGWDIINFPWMSNRFPMNIHNFPVHFPSICHIYMSYIFRYFIMNIPNIFPLIFL